MIWNLVKRECQRMWHNGIYGFSMLLMPIAVLLFFTSLMGDGQPHDMPIGVVDLDHSSTSRNLVRQLDAFQASRVAGCYNSVGEARRAMQGNEIYAFLLIPEGTASQLKSARQPQLSFYYSMASLTSGALLYKDLKTILTLGSAAAGQATLSAKGMTPRQQMAFLQPIAIDLHQLHNPWTNYSIYLSTMLIPGILLLFVMLTTTYSIGTEFKDNTQREWLSQAGGSTIRAVTGKLLPQTLVFLTLMYLYMGYIFGVLHFPHDGGWLPLFLLGLLSVTAAQGFGIFAFALAPSLRMSMSVCSLWGVVSFSIVGTAFPVTAMDTPLQLLSWLFPLRHHFLIYETCIFNAFPLHFAWPHWVALLAFCLLPLPLMGRLKRAIGSFTYTE